MQHPPFRLTIVNQGAPLANTPASSAPRRGVSVGVAGLLLAVLMLLVSGCPDRATGSDAPVVDTTDVTLEDLIIDQSASDVTADANAPDALDARSVSDGSDVRDVMDADVASLLDAEDVTDASLTDMQPRDVPPRDVPPFTAFDVTSADVADAGEGPMPPRLVGPLHATRVNSVRPTLRWELPTGVTGARIELCRDRECTRVLGVIDAMGASARPPTELPAGVVFWRAHPITSAGVGTRVSATWEFAVRWRDTPLDTSYGVMKDFNGDGYDDVAVGAGDYGTIHDEGRVYIYEGGPAGLDPTPQVIDNPDAPEPNFGLRLSPAGDVNGDGYADLLVAGFYYHDVTGRAYLYLGGPEGFSNDHMIAIDGSFGHVQGFGDDFTAGDFNGDGFSDVVITTGTGYVTYYPGSRRGVDPASGVVLTGAIDTSVAAIGDADGDGYCDLIAGAEYLPDRPHLLFGAPTGFRAGSEVPSAALGYSVASAGDINGDGFADFLIDDDGTAVLYLGGSGLHSPMPARFWSVAAVATLRAFGLTAGDPGDLNGDGYSDFVFGDYDQSRAYVYLGANDPPRVPAVELSGPSPRAYGWQPSCVGDVNGDGFDDAIVGESPLPRIPGEFIDVYFGGPVGVSTIPSQTLPSPSGPTSWTGFGAHIAARSQRQATRFTI